MTLQRKFSETEIDLMVSKIEKLLIRNGLVYPDDFDKMCSHLSEKEKALILKQLSSKKSIKVDDEKIIRYVPKEYSPVYDQKAILRDILKLDYVNTAKDYVQVGRMFFKGILCRKFPSTPNVDWLSKLVSEKTKLDYSIIMTQSDMSELRLFLRKELRKTEDELYKYRKVGRVSPELERKREDLVNLISTLGREYYEFKVALFLVVKGQSLEEVESLKDYAVSLLRGEDIIAEEATYLHEYVLKTIIPTGRNKLYKYELLVPDKSLQASIPFLHPWQDIEIDDEIILGFNESGLVVTGNIWNLGSYSGAYIGKTGSGKSLAAKYEIYQQMLVSGAKVIVIDPAAARLKDTPAEYYRMCRLLGGKYVSFSTDSKNLPNIMGTLPGTKFDEEMRRVNSIVRVFFEDEEKRVPEPQKPLIATGVVEAFRRKGITRNTKQFWTRKQPKLEDLLFALKKGLSSAKTEATRMSYEALTKRLEPCVGNGLRSYLNTPGKEEKIGERFTVFEFKDTPNDDKPILIARMLSYIKKVALESLDRTIIVLEEAQFWLRDPYLSVYLAETETTVRKTNTGLRLIFQDLGQLEGCREGLTLLGNLEFVYIFLTAPNLISLTKETFKLNEAEARVIETSKAGDYIILVWANRHYKLKITVDPETYNVITTNPEELKRIEIEEGVRKVESETKQLLKEDLGYDPVTIEAGLVDLASKIRNKANVGKIVKHYPSKYKKILEKLSKLK
ncbi:MAG: hypothetical protein AABX63_02355 [Nanoarchaeota archaeon]